MLGIRQLRCSEYKMFSPLSRMCSCRQRFHLWISSCDKILNRYNMPCSVSVSSSVHGDKQRWHFKVTLGQVVVEKSDSFIFCVSWSYTLVRCGRGQGSTSKRIICHRNLNSFEYMSKVVYEALKCNWRGVLRFTVQISFCSMCSFSSLVSRTSCLSPSFPTDASPELNITGVNGCSTFPWDWQWRVCNETLELCHSPSLTDESMQRT